MKKELVLGIIGTGRIGRLHARHLTSRIAHVRVKSVSDVRVKAAEDCATAFGIPEFHKDYEKILSDPEIDGVVICSSTDSHAPIMSEAARAGKHIFCEKPIALDLEVIDRALEEVKKQGVKLQIGFNRRFDANYRRIRELVASGAVGEPHILKITSRDPSPPPVEYVKVSGGIFLDMMIHDFDMARYLIGDEVEEVYAVGAVKGDPEIGKAGDIDTALVSLVFKNGVLGTIDNSRQAVYGYDQRAEVFGSKGMAASENNTPNRVRLSGAEQVSEDLPLNFFVERYVDSYIAELEGFVECVLEDREPPVGGLDGKYPVIMGIAAKKSLAEHRPVKLSEIAGV